jgi:aminomuconate-semialdehyde/2-hydroxymuconate-6-semialdehyde dehydrogenase
MEKLENYINGEFAPSLSGGQLENIEPASGRVYSLIPDSEVGDVEKAVSAASTAFPPGLA